MSLAPGNTDYARELNNFREEYKDVIKKSVASSTQTDNNLNFITPNTELKKMPQTPAINEQATTYDALIKKGDDAYRQQKYDEAIDYYTKAVVFIPADKVTMLKIANIYKLMGNNTKALGFYDKIIALDPNNTDAHFNKGLVYANQKNYNDSIKCFEKVIELSPNYPYAYYSLGMAYEQKNMLEKALEYYYLYSGIETNEKMLGVVNQKIKQLEGANGKK